MTVSNMTLVKIAAVGGIATALMGYMAQGKIQANVKSAPFYREALKFVRTNPAAVHFLGEPIKEGNIDVGNRKKNFLEGNQAQFEVPLKGPKQKGTLYLSASKADGDEQWSISRIELEVADRPDKRLIIKDTSNSW